MKGRKSLKRTIACFQRSYFKSTQQQATKTELLQEQLIGELPTQGILLPKGSPFSTAILGEPLPLGLKIPHLPDYDSTCHQQDLFLLSEAGYCKIFRTTLSGRALTWFNQLPAGTIEGFQQMAGRFLSHFSINKRNPKTAHDLFNCTHQEGKSLRDYIR